MSDSKNIFVTKPFLPPLEEVLPYLEEIWRTHRLTNKGPLHEKLEQELANYLGVPYISLFANGTLALLTALQCLDIKGEVITTPYSFVATSHVLKWNGLKPVFVDVEEKYGNLDPEKIEKAITKNTSAIMPVHVYGTPCEVEDINRIASRFGLKVIYDAAHAFGVKFKGKSILNYGDLSVLSFHATKVFNTFEGGAVISHDRATKKHLDDLKNFGFHGETDVVLPGINAKMNEMQAALGIVQLNHIDEVIERRGVLSELYRQHLNGIIGVKTLEKKNDCQLNNAYFPVFIDENEFGISRNRLYTQLGEQGIHGRRYFYPLISEFESYKDLESAKPENLRTAKQISESVICLPIYPDLKEEEVTLICRIIQDAGK